MHDSCKILPNVYNESKNKYMEVCMNLDGKIIKGVGGLYFVDTALGVFECSARGIFKNINQTLLIGDQVEIRVLEQGSANESPTGNIETVKPRKNELIRPYVSNIDQVILVLSKKSPEINLPLLDKFLLMAEVISQNAPTGSFSILIVINKSDLSSKNADRLIEEYQGIGYTVLTTSTKAESGLEALKERIKGKVNVCAGPSGVGKSSLINCLSGNSAAMKTGELSAKIERGKHTTRHTELIRLSNVSEDTFVIDSPGFSSLSLESLHYEKLDSLFPEFKPYLACCRFTDCIHLAEPDCAVKAQVGKAIPQRRYEVYLGLLNGEKTSKDSF